MDDLTIIQIYEWIDNMRDYTMSSGFQESLDELSSMVEKLESNKEQKMGRWKRVSIDKYVQHALAFYRCSECGKDHIGMTNFCSNYGTEMEVEHENS